MVNVGGKLGGKVFPRFPRFLDIGDLPSKENWIGRENCFHLFKRAIGEELWQKEALVFHKGFNKEFRETYYSPVFFKPGGGYNRWGIKKGLHPLGGSLGRHLLKRGVL